MRGLKNMFGIAIKPYDRGKAAYKKGVPSIKNPFPNHDPPRNNDDRWYLWKRGWRRAELEAIVAKTGSCAGAHARNDIEGSICDIGGVGWVSLDPGTSGARLGWTPIQCTTCGEIWSMDWGGYDHETNMEAARNSKFGHSFLKATHNCANCGISDYPTVTTPCINKEGDPVLTEWLKAKKELRAINKGHIKAKQKLQEIECELTRQPCPTPSNECGPTCLVCDGKGVIGDYPLW